jgi:hypothetical protein
MKESWEEHYDRIWTRLGWIGSVLVIFGYFLNANHNSSSWLVWLLGNVFVGGYCIHKKAYPTALMSFIIAIMNIYGFIRWSSV